MNHLQHASSPYLAQHQDQPVDWYSWGEEALVLAKKDDRPILVSIGYSTCHWCHVMARESFADKDVADYMNFHFVNIKIDREERPDLDAYFMDICQRLTGQGGWPLHVFLTPELKPFFAGNYFPPDPGGKTRSWFQVMQFVVHNYRNHRDAVEKQGDRLLQGLVADRQALQNKDATDDTELWLTETIMQGLVDKILLRGDTEQGGFGHAPKFPNTGVLELLLSYHFFTDHEPSLRQVKRSVNQMLRGGIYDQAGGGFARYAVDRAWKVPHFEKMLYDQALMIQLFSHLCRQKSRRMYRRALHEMLAFSERELVHPDGGWYAALDADAEGIEGAYYTWSHAEAKTCLPPGSSWLMEFFDLQPEGNWEGRNILWQPHELYRFADEHGIEPETVKEGIGAFKKRLLEKRQSRPFPHRDTKIVTDWNALMVSAYVQAGIALSETEWIGKATFQLNFLLAKARDPESGALRHILGTEVPGILSDYACLSRALLDLYLADQDLRWLVEAERLMEEVFKLFSTPGSVLFKSTPGRDHPGIIERIELRDEEIPNANAQIARVLLELSAYLDLPEWRSHALQMLYSAWSVIQKDYLAYASWYELYLLYLKGLAEISILGPDADSFREEVLKLPLPYRVVVSSEQPDDQSALLLGKINPDTQTVAYICQGEVCYPPVNSVDEVLALIK